MLSSMFALLAVTAVVLLVPAFAALLAVERRRHVAPGQDSRRRVRVVVAATAVALAALGVAALLQADAVAAVVVAVVLAGSVLAWAPMSRSWAVRGVVMWSLLVTAAVAVLGWIVQQMVASSMSRTEIASTAAVTLLLLVALARGQGYVRDVIAAQTGLGPRSPARQSIPVLRPLVSLAVLLAAGGAVLAVTSGDTGQDGGGSPQAGRSGLGIVPSPPEPSSASTSSHSGTSGTPSGDGRTPASPHETSGSVAGVPANASASEPTPRTALRTAVASMATGAPDQVREPRPGGVAATAPAARPTSGRPARPVRPTPSTDPWEGVDWDDPAPDEPSGGSTTYPEPTPASPSRSPSTRPGPPRPVPPAAPPRPVPPAAPPGQVGKTPGYAKPKVNHPVGAPAPGHGRQNRRQQPFPPYATVPRLPVR